jgi:hypothetical protein
MLCYAGVHILWQSSQLVEDKAGQSKSRVGCWQMWRDGLYVTATVVTNTLSSVVGVFQVQSSVAESRDFYKKSAQLNGR